MKRELKDLKLLSSGDVRKVLGVSYQFIERLVETGQLPYYQTSSGRIYREPDVLAVRDNRVEKAKTDKRVRL